MAYKRRRTESYRQKFNRQLARKRREAQNATPASLEAELNQHRAMRKSQKEQHERDMAPGGKLNPLEPRFFKPSAYPVVGLMKTTGQGRIRDEKTLVAYLKNSSNVPAEWECPHGTQGHIKHVQITREEFDHIHALMQKGHYRTGQCALVQFGTRWYRHPKYVMTYEQLVNNYVIVEKVEKHLG